MNFKALFLVLTTFLNLFFLRTTSLAQDETFIGGKAFCSVHGKSPVKKFNADGNRLLILQIGDTSKGSIQLQLISETESDLTDINILALLGEIADPESFLNAKAINVESSGSTFDIKKTIKNKNTTIELTNQISDEQSYNLTTKIKIKKTMNDLISGSLRISLENSSLESNTNNGKITVKCRLKDIPLQIKELAF